MTDPVYNQLVIDHFNRPQNVADGPSLDAVCGEAGSLASGVWMEFQLQIDGQSVQSARFRAYGCPHSVALASWLTGRLVGEKLDRDYTLDKREVVTVLGLPTEKMRSVLVAEDALRQCALKLCELEIQ